MLCISISYVLKFFKITFPEIIDMRMRKKPNLEKRLAACPGLAVDSPEELRGSWRSLMPGASSLRLELGCGKGRFTADSAAAEPDVLFAAVEKVESALVIAMERIRDRGISNVRFLDADAANLKSMFADGEADRIYINFCDPWPKSRDARLRLTAPAFLRVYCDLLPEGGEIHFKTDNTPLFDWSINRLQEEGWELRELTHDLHENGPVGVMTDYEAKFYSQGMKINRVVAVRTGATKGTAAGEVPRLKNASLVDARGHEESVRHFGGYTP